MSSLTIRIDDKLEAGLARMARARQQNKSELARQLLRDSLVLAAFDEARRKLTPLAERAGYLTDEDVFRDFS